MMREEASYKPLRVQIINAEAEYAELLKNNDSMNPNVRQAHDKLKNLQKKEQENLKVLTKTEKDIIRKTTNRVTTRTFDLKVEKAGLERLIKDTTSQINAFITKYGIDPNDKTTSWEEKCQAIINNLKPQIEEKTTELETKQQQLASLKKQKSALNNPGMLGKREDKDSYKKALKNLNTAIDKLLGEIAKLQHDLGTLNNEKAEVEKMKDLPKMLQEATEKLSKHPERMKKAKLSAQKEHTAIVQPLEKKAEAIINLNTAKKSQKTAESNLKKAEKTLKTANSKHQTAEKKLSKLNEENTLLVNTKTQLETLKSNLGTMKAPTLDNISRDLQKVLKEYNTALAAGSDYDTSTLNGKISTEINKIGANIGTINPQIKNAKAEVTAATTALDAANAAVTTATTALDTANTAVTAAVELATQAEAEAAAAAAPGASGPSPNMFQRAAGHGFRTLGGIALSAKKAVGKDPETIEFEREIRERAEENPKFKQLDTSKKSAVVRAVRKEMRRNPASTGHENAAAAAAAKKEEIERLLAKEITSANTVTIRQGELNFHHQGWTSVTLAQKSIFEETNSWGVSDIDPKASLEGQIEQLNEEYGTANANDKMAFSISGSEGSQKISTGRMDREAGKAMAKMLMPKENDDGTKKPLEFRSGDSNSGMEFLVGAGKQCILEGKPCNLQTHSASSHRNNTLQILNEISQIDPLPMKVSDQPPPGPEQQVIHKLETFMKSDSAKKFSPKDSAKFLVDIASSTKGGLDAITKVDAKNNPDLKKAIKAEIKSKVFKGNKLKTTKLVLQEKQNLRDSKKGLFFKGGNSKRAFMLAAKAMDDPGSRIVKNFLSEIKKEIEGAKETGSDPADLKDRVEQIVKGFHESMGLGDSKADMALKTNIAETVEEQTGIELTRPIAQVDCANKGLVANVLEKVSSIFRSSPSEPKDNHESRLENEHNQDATTSPPSPTGAS